MQKKWYNQKKVIILKLLKISPWKQKLMTKTILIKFVGAQSN